MTGPAVLQFSPEWRHRFLAIIVAAGSVFGVAGCGSFSGSDGRGSGGGSAGGGPEIRVLAPILGQTITGTVVHAQVKVIGVRLVNKVGQPNVAGECHLRVWVDDESGETPGIVETTPTFDLTGLAPGMHHLMIELRRNDDTRLSAIPLDSDEEDKVHHHLHFETLSALERIQQEIFTPKCATSGCHVTGGAAPMSLTDVRTSYQALVDQQPENGTARGAGDKRVAPNHPEQSFLLRKTTGEMQFGEGDPMPPSEHLTPDQLDMIRLWISQGAVPVVPPAAP